MNSEAPTWEIEWGYTITFIHKETGIALPILDIHPKSLIDVSEYNARAIAKNIATFASQVFLYKFKIEFGYFMNGSTPTFNIGDILWVKPNKEIWVEPDKYTVIYSDNIQIILQDEYGNTTSYLEPLPLTVFGKEDKVSVIDVCI